MSFYIIYPERRYVSEEVMTVWYDDAVANEEIDQTDLTSVQDMAAALCDAGLITLGEPR